MNLTFEVEFSREIYVDKSLFCWKIALKQQFRVLAILLGGGVILNLLGSIGKYFNNENFNFFTGIGMISLVLGLILLMLIIKSRIIFKRSLKKLADSYEKAFSKVTYEFDEEYFKYIDSKTEVKLKWDYFVDYMVINEIIFINRNENVAQSTIFKNSEFPDGKYSEVLEFLGRRLKLRLN